MFEPSKFVEKKVGEIQDTVKGKALVALSGGVDSTTSAILVNKALGKNLLCVLWTLGMSGRASRRRLRRLPRSLA